MRNSVLRTTQAVAAAGLLLCAASGARAQGVVDLLFEAPSGPVWVGETFELGLVARRGALENEPFSALVAILEWDSTRLRLLGNNDPPGAEGGYDWLSSEFPPVDADGLNATFEDGDAMYQALGQFTPPLPVATQSGLVVTRLVFRALRTGSTQIDIPLTAGSFTETAVLDDETPGLNILGITSPISVNVVVPEPSTAAFLLVVSTGFVCGRRRGRRGLLNGFRVGASALGVRS